MSSGIESVESFDRDAKSLSSLIAQSKQPIKRDRPTAEDKAAMGNGGDTPSQYEVPARAKTLNDLIEYKGMDFAVGNIFKAAYRLGSKDDVSEEYDLNKIIYYAKRKLKQIKSNG